MAEFKTVLETAHRGYHDRQDYPPYALASWDDRNRWSQYLKKINAELDAKSDTGESSPGGEPLSSPQQAEGYPAEGE